jgi:single-strand DNA-binding protein
VNLNKAFVLGNVTRDPEVRSLPSGQQVTNFGIATNRFYTDTAGERKQEAEFHNVVCFGKLADISSRYLTKGSLVLIEGRIKTRNWTNSQGAKQYKTEIIAEGLQLGPKGTGGSTNSNYAKFASQNQDSKSQKSEDEIPVIEENYPAPSGNQTNDQVSFKDNSSEEIDVKDIPF